MRNALGRIFSLPYVPVVAAPFVLMAPVYLTGRAIFWGTPLLQFFPWWAQAWRTLLSGDLPLWNPLLGMGAPLLANYQTALFYPPTWGYFVLYLFGGLPAMAWGGAVLVAAHLAWAGLGMALLARRLGLGALSQTVSGLAFGLSGYLVARSHFLSINAAAAWLPWVLLAAYKLAVQPRKNRNLLFLALALCWQLLAGHAQTAWYTLLLAVAWFGFWSLQHQDSGEFWRAWLQFGFAALIALALAAVQLLPTAEYLLLSARASQIDFDFAMTYSFWPWRLLGLFAPNLFGNPARGDYWGYATFWEDAVYIGLLSIVLALFATLRRGKQQTEKRLVWFLLTIVFVSFLFAFGNNTPLFRWLYHNVPTFDMFQAPARFSIWAVFALALLVGYGVERWRRPEGRALYWSRLGAAGAFAVSLGAGLGWYAFTQTDLNFGELQPTFVPALAIAGLWGLGAGVLNLLAPPKGEEKPSPIWQWAVVVLLSLDLLAAGWGLNPGAGLILYQDPDLMLDRWQIPLDGNRLYISAEEEQSLKFERFLSFETFDLDEDWSSLRLTGLPNTNLLDGFASANNFDPLLPARYERWIEALDEAPGEIREQMLARMDVGVVERANPRLPLGVEIEEVESAGRARWVPCIHELPISEDEALETILQGLDFSSFAVWEAVDAGRTITNCDDQGEGSVQIVAESANQITLSVTSSDFGYVVLADTYYPGWRAKVDGESVPIFKADYLFRGVAVPAGSHEVVFIYRPWSFYAGAAISLAALLVFVALWRRV